AWPVGAGMSIFCDRFCRRRGGRMAGERGCARGHEAVAWHSGRGLDDPSPLPWDEMSSLLSDVDAVVAGDALQARGVALADGAELPLRAVAVELAEDHGGLGGGVLGEVVAGQFLAVGAVDHADVGVADLSEGLLAAGGVV